MSFLGPNRSTLTMPSSYSYSYNDGCIVHTANTLSKLDRFLLRVFISLSLLS